MEAQHQRLAATLSAAPAPPMPEPFPVLAPAPQQQQEEQHSKHSPAGEEEPAERHYHGSQEVRRGDEMMGPLIGQTTIPARQPKIGQARHLFGLFLITIHNVNFQLHIHHHSAFPASSDMPPTPPPLPHPQTNRKSQTVLLPPTTTSVTSQDKKPTIQAPLPSSSPCLSPVRRPRPPPSIITPIPTPTTTTLIGSPRRNTAPMPPAGQVSPCPPNSPRLASIHNTVIRVVLVVGVVI